MAKFNVVSTFSGAGGLDLGFERVDEVSVEVMVDKDKNACNTLKKNFSKCFIFNKDIRNLSIDELTEKSGLEDKDVDLVIGGLPCQSFSKSANGRKSGINEERGMLFNEFIRFVDGLRPVAFLFENVPALRSSNGGKALELIENKLEDVGNGLYNLNTDVLNAAEYGVPQSRRRLFILGMKGRKPRYPRRTHKNEPDKKSGMKPYKTAGDALEGLDSGIEKSGKEEIGGKWGHLLDNIPPGENYQFYTEKRKQEYGHDHDVHFEWRSRYWTFLLKLDPEKPSNTIKAKPGKYIGPFHWRNRRLTHKERKRLMTIPDNWEIKGNKKEKRKQVGNAVPPLLAEKLARSIVRQL